MLLYLSGDLCVIGSTQTNITDICRLVAKPLNGSCRRPGHVGVQQEAHWGGSTGQRVVLLLFDQLPGELQGRANVLQG